MSTEFSATSVAKAERERKAKEHVDMIANLEESIANDTGSQPIREQIVYPSRPARVKGPDLVTEGPDEVYTDSDVMGFVMIGLFAFAGTSAIIYLLTIAACKP